MFCVFNRAATITCILPVAEGNVTAYFTNLIPYGKVCNLHYTFIKVVALSWAIVWSVIFYFNECIVIFLVEMLLLLSLSSIPGLVCFT